MCKLAVRVGGLMVKVCELELLCELALAMGCEVKVPDLVVKLALTCVCMQNYIVVKVW